MKHQFLQLATAAGLAVCALNAYAQQAGKGMDMGNMKMDSMEMGSAKAASLATNEAIVQAIDKPGKTVTIKHGPLKSKTVEMPGMTMTFPVENTVLLSKVQAGDKVKITVETVEGEATVTALTVQK
jgi:Cu/Ag efflux protein CusF